MSNPPGDSGASDDTGSRVARNSAWLIGQPLALNVLSIASTAYIARQLGGEGFATFNIGIAFALMFAPLTNMGLRALTVRHVAQFPESARDYLGTVMALRLVLAALAFAVVMVAAPLGSENPETRQVALIAAVVLIFNTIVGVLTDGFHAREDMGRPARAAMVAGLVLTVVSVVAAAMGGGPTALAATYLVGPFLNAVMLYASSGPLGIRPRLIWDPREFKRLLTEALPFFGQGLLESISSRLDLFILARTVGEANMGGYTAARMLISRAAVVVDGSGTALLPSLARLRAIQPEAATPLVRKTILWLSALTLPLAAGISIASPEIVQLLFGSEFADGALVLSIGVFALPITATAVVLGHGLFAAHRNRLVVGSSMTATTLTTTGIIPATLTLGILGAPIVRVMGRTLLVLMRLPRALQDYPGLWHWADTVRLASATLAVVIPALLGRAIGGGIPTMLAAGAIAAMAWLAAIVWMGMVPDALLKRLRFRRGAPIQDGSA